MCTPFRKAVSTQTELLSVGHFVLMSDIHLGPVTRVSSFSYFVTCFEVTRHSHVSRLVADSCTRSNNSTVTLQQGRQSVISLQPTRGHFRPEPGTRRREKCDGFRQSSEKQFKSQGAVQRQVELEFRSLASLAVWSTEA
jgi:hypothetical protein